ncbi:unnamed protein product [Owenia fusiformis]|uniref:Large ribosomal subunit protein uL4m n=1 Tax=Owenia fusiformis TaxID=6347 RepID=A0A8J1U6A3_OWEFU|nr:unnamed protein product [Owenia fusiformis]
MVILSILRTNGRPLKTLCEFACSQTRLLSSTSTRKVQDGLEEYSDSKVISRPPTPIITSRNLDFMPRDREPAKAWLETMDTIEGEKLGMIDLHPDIFNANPRLDVLHRNIMWQRAYRRISYAKTKSRAEVRGGGRKPRPQKGSGRSRQGSIRAPQWRGGGVAHGPRGPKSYYYMEDFNMRVQGLMIALTVKYAQNYLHVVDNFDIPTEDPEYLQDILDHRKWGLSALLVDDVDMAPTNMALACSNVKHINIMPVYGLNVYSMLKHEGLILTLAAVEKIEERLLYHLHRPDYEQVGWLKQQDANRYVNSGGPTMFREGDGRIV